MEEKKRTIVMFGDSLTDYFPMEKLKDIDAQFINSGVAGDTIAEMGARLAYDVFPYNPEIIIMQGGANDFLMSLYPGARVLAERLIRLARRIRQQLPDTKIYIESMYPAYTKRIGLMPSWAEGKSNEEIQKINTEIQRLCKEDNFEYVDVFDKLIGEDGQLSREYTVDGIHLQENAYDVVAAIIYHLMEGRSLTFQITISIHPDLQVYKVFQYNTACLPSYIFLDDAAYFYLLYAIEPDLESLDVLLIHRHLLPYYGVFHKV